MRHCVLAYNKSLRLYFTAAHFPNCILYSFFNISISFSAVNQFAEALNLLAKGSIMHLVILVMMMV